MAKFQGKTHNKASVQSQTDLWDLAGQVLGGLAGKAGGFLQNLIPSDSFNYDYRPAAPKVATPVKAAEPSPSPQPRQAGLSEDQIKKALLAYSPDSPLATQSGVLANALQQLDPAYDPRMVLSLALKETRGGKDLIGRNQGLNNPFNVKYGGRLINYPDLQTALLGGPNALEDHDSQGLINVLNGPIYADYRKSKDPNDFFKHYSNPNDRNAALDVQKAQLEKLLRLFNQ